MGERSNKYPCECPVVGSQVDPRTQKMVVRRRHSYLCKNRNANRLGKRDMEVSPKKAFVWDKTGGLCAYCGVDLNPFRNMTLDHIVPKALGGTDDAGNLVFTCTKCNQDKGDQTLDEFRLMPNRRCAGFLGERLWFEVKGRKVTERMDGTYA